MNLDAFALTACKTLLKHPQRTCKHSSKRTKRPSSQPFSYSTLPSWFWQELSTREYGRNLKISLIGRKGLIPLKLSAALDRDQRRDIEDLACHRPSSAEVEELLRWVLRNIHETSTHPKLPSLLQELTLPRQHHATHHNSKRDLMRKLLPSEVSETLSDPSPSQPPCSINSTT